jgi:hypothetical protein
MWMWMMSEVVLGYLRAWLLAPFLKSRTRESTQNPQSNKCQLVGSHSYPQLLSPNVEGTSTSMPDLTPSSTVNDGLSMPGTVSGVQTPTVKDPARFLTPKARKTEADGSECWLESSRGY